MKKWLLWLLAGMMLFTACTSGGTNTSTPSEGSETSEGGTTQRRTLISLGKPYTAENQAPSDRYPDYYGQQLTDGIKANTGADYTEPKAVGFEGGTNIIIDLQEDGKRINSVSIGAIDMGYGLTGQSAGVAAPALARITGSNDGVKYEPIERITDWPRTGDKTISRVSVDFDPVDYRYIKIQIGKRNNAAFIFLDEIEIYADVDPKEVSDTVTLAYQNESIDRNAWKELSTGNAAEPISTKNVLLGKSYTFENCSFDERAPKNETHLTDGIRTQRNFGEDAWVGIKKNGGENAPSIKFNLGSRHKNIYSFKVHALGVGTDVKYPDYIDVYGSTDNKTYTLLGRMYAPSDCEYYAYTLIMKEYVEARYIRFEFPNEDGNYWIEEVEVFVGSNTEDLHETRYPELNLPTVTEDLFWDSTEADYSTVQNLLINADQQMAVMDYNGTEAIIEHHQPLSPYDCEALADGKRASNSAYSNIYGGEFFFSLSSCIDIFYDLSKISSINELNVHLLEATDMAVKRPDYISVFLSDDGDNWYKVGAYEIPDDAVLYNKSEGLTMPFVLDKTYAARFVRFRIENTHSVFLFVDELEAIGTKEVTADAVRLADSGINPVTYYTNKEREEYVTLENSSLNSNDMPLICLGQGSSDQLLPMVAYLDEEGNIKDTMFDGFLYWCATGDLPSGSKTYTPATFEDWQHQINYTFTNDVNGIDKLEEVVGQVKEALNMPDYKVKVYVSSLSIFDDPNAHASSEANYSKNVTEFGDIDGDGVVENLTKYEDRQKLYKWFIDEVNKMFTEKNYQNIEFDGINYLDESVYWECDNSKCIEEFGAAVKASGTNFIWIPYYKANRFYIGEELHFDAICMQPNYAFKNDIPEWRLEASADMVKRLGMSIELEHHYLCIGDRYYARQYMKYLASGVEYGFIDGIHMYFQDNDNYGRLGYSDEPLARMQYDATYHFIKQDLDITPETRETLKVSATKDTILRGELKANAEDFELYTIVKQPEHGTVALNMDGEYVYYPEKGYTGTDSFSYTYNEYLGESEECVVEITVG